MGINSLALNSLASVLDENAQGGVSELPIKNIRRDPNQPRTVFDTDKLKRTAESIKAQGVVQPIVVRMVSDGYVIVAGERRWRASQIANLETIPAVVRDLSPEQIIAVQIIENLDREGLSLLDEVNATKRACEVIGSSKATAKALGKPPSWVSKRMKIAKSGADIQGFVESGFTSDIEGVYQLARLMEKHQKAAVEFTKTWQLKPEKRGNLRVQVAQIFASLERKEESDVGDPKSPDNAVISKKPKDEAAGLSVKNKHRGKKQDSVDKEDTNFADTGNCVDVMGYEIVSGQIILFTLGEAVTLSPKMLKDIYAELPPDTD